MMLLRPLCWSFFPLSDWNLLGVTCNWNRKREKTKKAQNAFIRGSHLPKIQDFGLCPRCLSYPSQMQRQGSVQVKLNIVPNRLIEHECSALIQTTNTACI